MYKAPIKVVESISAYYGITLAALGQQMNVSWYILVYVYKKVTILLMITHKITEGNTYKKGMNELSSSLC